MFEINEYKILRIIKTYFSMLKDNASAFSKTFDNMFSPEDLDQPDYQAFKDVIINGKIQYRTTYNNLSAEFPTIVVVMDQETQLEEGKPIGDVAGASSESLDTPISGGQEYGYVEYGVYSINVYSKQILVTRLLSALLRLIIEHYATNNDGIYDLDINVDRFSPDADYFPADVFHVHLIVRFRYIETWDEIYNLIHGIFFTSCGGDITNYITKPVEAELTMTAKTDFGSGST